MITNKLTPYLSVIVFILTAINSHGNTVYVVNNPTPKEIKVFITKYPNQADLLIHEVSHLSKTTPNPNLLWYFVKYPNQANLKIRYVKFENQSDLKIYFVKYPNQVRGNTKSLKNTPLTK
jgi:hypothetical protein